MAIVATMGEGRQAANLLMPFALVGRVVVEAAAMSE